MDFYTFDDEYVRRLREGDRRVSEHFATYFGGLLRAKLRRRHDLSREDIEDLIQDVLLRVLGKLPELHDSSKLGAFVFSVCIRTLKEWDRKQWIRFTDGEIDIPGPDDLEKDLLNQDAQRCVNQVLDELPKHDADLLRAVFLEEADKDEICRRFGVDREYLRVLIHRAKKRFRELYCEKFGEPPET